MDSKPNSYADNTVPRQLVRRFTGGGHNTSPAHFIPLDDCHHLLEYTINSTTTPSTETRAAISASNTIATIARTELFETVSAGESLTDESLADKHLQGVGGLETP